MTYSTYDVIVMFGMRYNRKEISNAFRMASDDITNTFYAYRTIISIVSYLIIAASGGFCI